MLLDSAQRACPHTEALIERRAPFRWGVDSETGRLTDVLLSTPEFLAMIPCNAVTRESIASGHLCCNDKAAREHRALTETLERAGVDCHFVAPAAGMPDLAFTRDAALITPWGFVELRPASPHRQGETEHVAAVLKGLGVPALGRIEEGRIEGGDVAILRPGLVMIGYSGERSDKAGSRALARLFERQGWQPIYSCFDPRFLHLDTQFTMIARNTAVACLDTLEDGFVDRMAVLGIELIAATRDEVDRLGANLLALGENRIVAPAGNPRLNGELKRRGYDVLEVEIDQFARCGGGVHCLTLPLGRLPG